MIRKLCFTLGFVLVFGVVGSVSAGTWTNGDADNDWCNGLNWSGSAPSASVDAIITGTPPDEVIIYTGCDAFASNIAWTVNADQSLTIEAGGSLTVSNNFSYRDGGETATVNIYGELIIDADSSSDGDEVSGRQRLVFWFL